MQTANVRTTPSARPAYKRRRRRIKPYIINRCIFAAIALAVIILVIMAITLAVSGARDAQKPAISTPGQTAGQFTQTPGTSKSEATETPQTPAVFFALTPEQRTLIEQVVSAESRGEPYDGQVAVGTHDYGYFFHNWHTTFSEYSLTHILYRKMPLVSIS